MTDYFKCLQLLGKDAEEIMDLDEVGAHVAELQSQGVPVETANLQAVEQMIGKLRGERQQVEDQVRPKLGRKSLLPAMRKVVKDAQAPLLAKKKEEQKKRIKVKAKKVKAKQVESLRKGGKSAEKQAEKPAEAPLQQEDADVDTAAYEQLDNREKALVKKAVTKIAEGKVLNKAEEAVVRKIAPDFDSFVATVAIEAQKEEYGVDTPDQQTAEDIYEGIEPELVDHQQELREAEENSAAETITWYGKDWRRGQGYAEPFASQADAEAAIAKDFARRGDLRGADLTAVKTSRGWLVMAEENPLKQDPLQQISPLPKATEEDFMQLKVYTDPGTKKVTSMGEKSPGMLAFYTEDGTQHRINMPSLVQLGRRFVPRSPEQNRMSPTMRTAQALAAGIDIMLDRNLSTSKERGDDGKPEVVIPKDVQIGWKNGRPLTFGELNAEDAAALRKARKAGASLKYHFDRWVDAWKKNEELAQQHADAMIELKALAQVRKNKRARKEKYNPVKEREESSALKVKILNLEAQMAALGATNNEGVFTPLVDLESALLNAISGYYAQTYGFTLEGNELPDILRLAGYTGPAPDMLEMLEAHDIKVVDYEKLQQKDEDVELKELRDKADKARLAKGNTFEMDVNTRNRKRDSITPIVVPAKSKGSRMITGIGKSVRKKDVSVVRALAHRFGLDFDFQIVDEDGAGTDIEWRNPETLAAQSEIEALSAERLALMNEAYRLEGVDAQRTEQQILELQRVEQNLRDLLNEKQDTETLRSIGQAIAELDAEIAQRDYALRNMQPYAESEGAALVQDYMQFANGVHRELRFRKIKRDELMADLVEEARYTQEHKAKIEELSAKRDELRDAITSTSPGAEQTMAKVNQVEEAMAEAEVRLKRAQRKPIEKGLISVDEGKVTIFVSRRAKGDQERLSIIGHEMGHALMQAVRHDWSEGQKQRIWKIYKDSTEGPHTLQDFDEWFANQVMAYATADPRARKLMARGLMGNRIRGAFAKLRDLWRFLRNRFQLNEDFKTFLDEVANSGERHFYAVPTTKPLAWTAPPLAKEQVNRLLRTRIGQVGQSSVEDFASVMKRIGNEYIGSVGNWFHQQRDIKGRKIPALLKMIYSFHQSPNTDITGQEKELSKKYGFKVDLMPRDYRNRPIRESMEHSIQKSQGKFTAALNKVIEDVLATIPKPKVWNRKAMAKYEKDVEVAFEKIHQELRSKDIKSPEAKAIRKIYDDLYDYVQEYIPDMRKRADYTPVVWDSNKVADNYEQLVEDLMNPASWQNPLSVVKTKERAEEIATELLGDDMAFMQEQNGTNGIQGAFTAMRQREINDLKPEIAAKYQNNDIIDITRNYIHAAVKRAEFDRRFGRYQTVGQGDKQKDEWFSTWEFDRLKKEATSQMGEWVRPKVGEPRKWIGASQAQVSRLETNIKAMRGQLGQNMPASVRHVMGWMMTAMNFLTLGFSTLASLPDLAGIAIRSHGNREAAWKGYVEGMKATYGKYRGNKDKLWEMGEQLGILTDELHSAVIQEQHGMQFLSPKSQRWNEKWFRMTLLHQFTLMTRAMGIASARYFITSSAKKVRTNDEKDRNTRYLRDLGLTEADVVVDANGQLMRSAKIDAAINTYVNQSILRPTPAQRPAWGSDPRFMLFFHLKSFTYSFWETIVRGTYNEVRARGNEGMSIPAQAAPALVAALTLLPLAAAGLLIRDLIGYGTEGHPRRQNMASPEYIYELVQRTGLTGPALQMFIDMEEAEDRGKLAILGVMGPTASRVFDAGAKEWDMNFLLRNIPIISQIPQLREALLDAYGE